MVELCVLCARAIQHNTTNKPTTSIDGEPQLFTITKLITKQNMIFYGNLLIAAHYTVQELLVFLTQDNYIYFFNLHILYYTVIRQ